MTAYDFTADEVAELLGLTRRQVLYLVRQRRLQCYRINRNVYGFTQAMVDAFLAESQDYRLHRERRDVAPAVSPAVAARALKRFRLP